MVILDPHAFGSTPAHLRTHWYLNIIGNWQLVHVAFKSFDLNLLMAHSAIFLKRVCHQVIYDNWHTATCMNCYSAVSTKNLAQKVSLKLVKLNKLLLST